MTVRTKAETWLYLGVLGVLAALQCASCVHLVTLYAMANIGFMAYILAAATVLGLAALLALTILTAPGRERTALQVAVGALMVMEFVGNFVGGILIANYQVPAELEQAVPLTHIAAVWAIALLFAGMIPVLVWLQLYATVKVGAALLETPAVNPLALAVIQREQEAARRDLTSHGR